MLHIGRNPRAHGHDRDSTGCRDILHSVSNERGGPHHLRGRGPHRAQRRRAAGLGAAVRVPPSRSGSTAGTAATTRPTIARISQVVVERDAGRSLEAAIALVLQGTPDAGPGRGRRHRLRWPPPAPVPTSRSHVLSRRADAGAQPRHRGRVPGQQRPAAPRRGAFQTRRGLPSRPTRAGTSSWSLGGQHARVRRLPPQPDAAAWRPEVPIRAGRPAAPRVVGRVRRAQLRRRLAGWERADGRFEAVWSVEPDAVRTRHRAGAAAGRRSRPPAVPRRLPTAARRSRPRRHAPPGHRRHQPGRRVPRPLTFCVDSLAFRWSATQRVGQAVAL